MTYLYTLSTNLDLNAQTPNAKHQALDPNPYILDPDPLTVAVRVPFAGRKSSRKVRSGKDDVAPDENKIKHPILKDVEGKGGQKQLCDMCNDWMDRCT